MNNKISYSAIILDKDSRVILEQNFKHLMPEGWEWICDHMTITLGPLPDELKNMLKKQIELTVKTFGINDKVMAIGVGDFYSANKIPHITLAVNRNNGGKPYMTNYIDNWITIKNNIPILTGHIDEIPHKSNSLNEIYQINSLPFYNDVIKNGGNIYQIGGSVRDMFLGKDSKDLDIVISGISIDNLEKILKKHGKTNMVGSSFGVIKFTPPNGEEIDIALPRSEKKNDLGGYRGFDIQADHTLPIEKDLERRDYTINSIAKDTNGNIIDPFKGIDDIKNKIIRVTNPKAFSDDPLRMLRGVSFGSRFNFTIEPKTFKLIQKNAYRISEITKERILIEFDKIVNKGDPVTGAKLLVETNLYEHIFNTKFTGKFEHFAYVERMSEFMYWLTECFTEQPDFYFKVVMKGDIETTKEISALAYLYKNNPKNDITKQRWCYFNINKISPIMLTSNYALSLLSNVQDDFNDGIYPKSMAELEIDGNDLINMGYKGAKIGSLLNDILGAIYSDEIDNDRTEILNFIKNKTSVLNENVQPSTSVIFMDFDGCMAFTPTPDWGKEAWSQFYEIPYPYLGWWGKKESLDQYVFDIKINKKIKEVYDEKKLNHGNHLILLTNRQKLLEPIIKNILEKWNVSFELYSFVDKNPDKGQRILDIMKNNYPDIKNIEFYDDDIKNIISAQNALEKTDYDFVLNHVN